MVTVAIKPKVGKLVLKHPVTGEEYFDTTDGRRLQGILHLVGTCSPQFRNTIKQISGSIEQQDDVEDKIIAGCIVGWEDTGFIAEEYSPENAFDLINNPENLWIKVQVKSFIDNQAHFFS